jgi:hypothetical protein
LLGTLTARNKGTYPEFWLKRRLEKTLLNYLQECFFSKRLRWKSELPLKKQIAEIAPNDRNRFVSQGHLLFRQYLLSRP